MAKYSEIVYMCLDELRLFSDDSYYTEDHIAFLADKYRSYLLEQKYSKDVNVDDDDYQEICLDLEQVSAIPGIKCVDMYLRSVDKLPGTMDIGVKRIYPVDYFSSEYVSWTSPERMRYVGNNKWLKDMIYVTEGPDKHLYLRSASPQFLNLTQIRVSAVFSDAKEAAEYACECSDKVCDWLDAEFPLEGSMIPLVVQNVVKELAGVKYQPADQVNNANDDTPNIGAMAQQAQRNQQQQQQQS